MQIKTGTMDGGTSHGLELVNPHVWASNPPDLDSIPITSTLHPAPCLQVSTSRGLEIEEQPTDGLDVQNYQMSPQRLVMEEQTANQLDVQALLEQSQIDFPRCQELLSGHEEKGEEVRVIEKEAEDEHLELEEETEHESVVKLQSSQLLTSVLKTFLVPLEPGLLASLNSGMLQVIQDESTHLPVKELDGQMTDYPKTKVGPDINWDGDNSLCIIYPILLNFL